MEMNYSLRVLMEKEIIIYGMEMMTKDTQLI